MHVYTLIKFSWFSGNKSFGVFVVLCLVFLFVFFFFFLICSHDCNKKMCFWKNMNAWQNCAVIKDRTATPIEFCGGI